MKLLYLALKALIGINQGPLANFFPDLHLNHRICFLDDCFSYRCAVSYL